MPLLGFVPSRTILSGKKRDRIKNPFNNVRPYKPARPGMPVPEPLPPAPILGPAELLGLGLIALAQAWGQRNSKPKTTAPLPPEEGGNISGTMPSPTNSQPGTIVISRVGGKSEYSANSDCSVKSNSISDSRELKRTTVTNISFRTESGPCGVNKHIFRLESANGAFTDYVPASTGYGWSSVGFKYDVQWLGPDPVQWAPTTKPVPLPPGYDSPEYDPEPATEPETVPVRKPAPVLPPAPLPGTSPTPSEPGVAKPPAVVPGLPGIATPPALPGQGTDNGTLVPTPKPPITVTDPDVVFPIEGGQPVGGIGQKPAETIKGVAQEVGRIERKLELIMNPLPNTLGKQWDAFWRLVDAIQSITGGGVYELTEPCDPDDDGVFEKREVYYSGALDAIGLLHNKIDALAQLAQASKELRQPICTVSQAYMGTSYSVQFRSVDPSPYSTSRLRKVLRYRDQTGKALEDHGRHWADFEWESGPWMVISSGLPWGKPRVWAKSAAEGKRVISHAAAIAGVDLSSTDHRWTIREVANPRYGPVLRMKPHRDATGRLWVSTRDDSDGLPFVS